MTAPRQIVPGTTYLVTRRCSERRFFLRPSAATNATFAYLLGVAASRYGILVHAYCVLSNHVHLIVTDRDGRLPDFHRDLDGLVARAMNRALGRWESFWDPESYSAVRLETRSDILKKIVYVLANPVLAGLVRRAREWPGLWSDPKQIGAGPVTIERPNGFFRRKGPLPPAASLELSRPPGFEEDASFPQAILDALTDDEDRVAAERARAGSRFVGASRVLAQKPTDHPLAREPRRTLNPTVACRSKWKRIEALMRVAEFRCAYREALAKWRAGVRDVVFPWGTWHMRVHHTACCAAG